MSHHKITCEDDIRKLQAIYEDGAIFEILETHEEMELTTLLHFYNERFKGREITIQHI
jgi:hypothetical protein